MFVANHPALPGPILLTSEEAQRIQSSVVAGKANVLVEGMLLPMAGLSLIPHDAFLKADIQQLANRRQIRCAYGRVHEVSDTGGHEECERNMNRDSPYVNNERIEKIELRKLELEGEKLGLPPGQPLDVTLNNAMAVAQEQGRNAVVVKTTIRLLRRGQNVFRTLVRSYRRDPNLVPEEWRAHCADYDSAKIESVPLKAPFQIAAEPVCSMPA